jgi:hypothetical protein
MPPKPDTYLTPERIKEVKHAIEKQGIETVGMKIADVESVSEALESGWKLPKKHVLEEEQEDAKGHSKHARLSTYLVHQARAYSEARQQ